MRVVRILSSATVTGSCLLFECHKFAPGCLTSPVCVPILQDIVAAESTARGDSQEGEGEGERVCGEGHKLLEHERVRARYFIFISIGKLLVQLPHT